MAGLYENQRQMITELVEGRIRELNNDWFTVVTKHIKLWPEPLCPLVNPLCPDDLCWLPAGHVGSDKGFHVLGTTSYSNAERLVGKGTVMYLVYPGTSREALADIGWNKAKELWPQDFRD